MEGKILGMSFSTTFGQIDRIQIECDMVETALLPETPTLYRHVFVESGCGSATYEANLRFTNMADGLWGDPKVVGAVGCERVRFMVKGSSSDDFEVTDFTLMTEGCPKGQWKDGDVCVQYDPGFYCHTEVECVTNDPCGDAAYYCTGDGNRRSVSAGYYSTPEDAQEKNKQTGQAICEAGRYCGGDSCNAGEACDCPSGRFSSIVGATECQEAEEGHYAAGPGGADAATNQTRCEPGRYSAQRGKAACDKCAAGMFAQRFGMLQCVRCGAGRYANRSGSSVCAKCRPGRYRPEGEEDSDHEDCLDCSAATDDAAVCPDAGMNQTKNCKDYAPDAIAVNAGGLETRCQCDAQFYGYSGLAGVGAVARLSDKQTLLHLMCEPCPLGVLCNEVGNEFHGLEVVAGMWQDYAYFAARPQELSTTGVEECRQMQGTVCPGGGWNATCKYGHQGALCGVCVMGPDVMSPTHYRNKDGACVECGDTTFSWAAAGLFFLGILIVALVIKKYGLAPCHCCWALSRICIWKCFEYVTCQCLRKRCRRICCCCRWKCCRCRRPEVPHHHGEKKKTKLVDKVRVKLKIIITFYQILMSISNTLTIKWPSFTLNYLVWMRLFTLDLPVLPFVGCLSRSSFVNTFFLTVSGPPIIIASMMMLQTVGLVTGHEVWRNTIYLLFLCYPRTCETIVNALLPLRQVLDVVLDPAEPPNCVVEEAGLALHFLRDALNSVVIPQVFALRLHHLRSPDGQS